MPWSLPTPPAVAGPYVFGAGNGSGHLLFVARDGSTIYSTDDGVTWSTGGNPLSGGECYGATYHNSRWILWGNNGTNAVIAHHPTVSALGSATIRTGTAGRSFVHFAGSLGTPAAFGGITDDTNPVLHFTLDNLGTAWQTEAATLAFNPQFLVASSSMGDVGTGWYTSESGSGKIFHYNDFGGGIFADIVVGGFTGGMGGAPGSVFDVVVIWGEDTIAQIDTTTGDIVVVAGPNAGTGIIVDRLFAGGTSAGIIALSSFDADVMYYSNNDGLAWSAATGPAHAFTTDLTKDTSGVVNTFYAWGDGLLVGTGVLWSRLPSAETGAPASYTEIAGARGNNGTFVAVYNQDPANVIIVRHVGGAVNIQATLPAASTLTGYLRKAHTIEGSISAASTLSGALGDDDGITGLIAGASSLVGAASLTLGAVGSISATSALSAAVLLGSDNIIPATVGLLEALTDAIGSADNEIGGLNATRMTVEGTVGATSITVETAYQWPESGKISIDGIVYQYASRTATSFSGLEHVSAGITVAGLKRYHAKQAVVLDLSQTRSALDKVRRAMLVEYAEGADLNVVGRNLGVLRPPALADDARFRDIIKAIAYNPRGTMYGIELALIGIVGAGNFEIFEDLVSNKCKVYISLTNEALASGTSAGKAYLSGSYSYAISGANNQVNLTAQALAARIKNVQGVRLKNEDLTTTTRIARPSAHLITEYVGDTPRAAWAYEGVTVESTNATLIANDGGVSRLAITTANAAMYHRYARIQPESDADFAVMMNIPTGTTLNSNANQIAIQIRDGARKLNIGITTASASTYNVGFCDNSALGAFIAGAAAVLTMGTYYEIGIQKRGESVYLMVDGKVVQTLARSSFATTGTVPSFSFGAYPNASATVGAQVRFSSVRCWATTPTDYWPKRGVAASVQTTDPDRINTGIANTFGTSSVGKQVRVTGSAITNAQGGNNNGRFLVKTVLSDTIAVLEGALQKKLSTSIATPTRITTAEHLFRFPQDLGKKVTISGSVLGNNGTFVISALRDDISLVDLSTYNTKNEVWTNVAELTGAAFQTESDLQWRLEPNFLLEAGLDWELSGGGAYASSIATLPAAMPYAATAGFPVVVDLFVTEVLSAQILEDSSLGNEVIATTPKVLYEYYPFYLSDPLGVVRVFLDELTAAGVIPEYRLT